MAEAENKPLLLPQGFAHDGEHPQVAIPFTVLVSNRQLRGESLSLTRAVATGLMPRAADTLVSPVTLHFDMDGFSVSLYVSARIETAAATEDGKTELFLIDPTGPHVAPLRYILNSFIAGDIVTMGGVLGYTGPVTVKPRADARRPGLWARVSRWFRRGMVVVLSLALAVIAGSLILNRVLFAYEPRPVTLEPAGQAVRATAAGQLSYVDTNATPGKVLYSVLANSGDLISVRMPCDCTVLPGESFAEGATVLPGETLVRLVESEAGLEAETMLTFAGSTRLAEGDAAQLVFDDGQIVPVTLTMKPERAAQSGTVAAQVNLPTGLDRPSGATARLRFQRQLLPAAVSRWWRTTAQPGLAALGARLTPTNPQN